VAGRRAPGGQAGPRWAALAGKRPRAGRRRRAGGRGRAGRPALGGQAAARWAAQAGRRPRAGQRGRAGGRVLGCAGGTARRFYDGEDARAALCFFSFFSFFFVVGFAFQEAIHKKKLDGQAGELAP